MSDDVVPAGTPLAPSAENEPDTLPAESSAEEQELPSIAEAQRAEPLTEAELPPSAEVETEDIPEAASTVAETAEPEEQETPEIAPIGELDTQKGEMQDMLTEEYTYTRPKRGEIRKSRIIASTEEGMIVDLGLKHEGLIPAHDLQRVSTEVVDSTSIGDEIPIYIVRPNPDQEGRIIVSWQRARQEQDWIDAQALQESGDLWEGQVKGYNRGGLIVHYGRIRGFVPASHISGISRRMGQASLQARLAEKVGQSMPLRVLEVDRQKRRLIFSERTARRQWRAQQREKLLDELREGDHVHGVVSNVCDFGAFVDIGGTDGLVHISELSWRRSKHPSEVVRTGDEVDAYVLRVDRERKRIGLSLRLLQPDPWESVEEKYEVGQLVTGIVTKITDFGAFAALDDGIEGLIHISELADVSPRHPSEVITAETVLPLIIVKIDARRRRMGLSLKRVSEEEWFEWEEQRRATVAPEELEPSAEVELDVEPAEVPQPVEAEASEEVVPLEEPQLETTPASSEPEVVAEAEPAPPEPPVGEVTEPLAAAEAASPEPPPEMPVELPPEEIQESLLAAEAPAFAPAEEILLEKPPLEEMQEPPLTVDLASLEPPDEPPMEEPPPEAEDQP
jgi:small subunit ribosomal protein S1